MLPGVSNITNSRLARRRNEEAKKAASIRRRTVRKTNRHFNLRLDSSTDRIYQTIFAPDVMLESDDMAYLNAAESGNMDLVIHYIANNINIDCVDYLGRSALELAVKREQVAVINYILPISNIQSVSNALLAAIRQDNVSICEIILKHPIYKQNPGLLQSGASFYQQHAESYKDSDVTPIVLAAQRNNYYIVQLLLLSGSQIEKPHDYFCNCTDCQNKQKFDNWKYRKYRLATYKALASPVYLSLGNEDPILEAFKLSSLLEKLAGNEKELKSEYKELSQQCKDYAVDLVDMCRSKDEVTSMLAGQDEEFETLSPDNRLNLAIKYSQKKFIAHSACQGQIEALWVSNGSWLYKNRNPTIILLMVPLFSLLLPVNAILFAIFPHSKLGRFMRCPQTKFIHHLCSYLAFIVLVIAGSTREGHPFVRYTCHLSTPHHNSNSHLTDVVVAVMIAVWVVGYLMYECRQIWSCGISHYLRDFWNWMDTTLIIFYLCSFTLQIVASKLVFKYPQMCAPYRNNEPNCQLWDCYFKAQKYDFICKSNQTISKSLDPRQLSDIFFAIANLMSFMRIIYLLPAVEQLGPLQISFARMLKEMTNFFFMMILCFMAFTVGLSSLYQVAPCENKFFTGMLQTTGTLFWATFGMGDRDSYTIDDKYRLDGLSKGVHGNFHSLTESFGFIFFAGYVMTSVVVLLNMLIAMMSNSFQEVYDDRDVEWKFARAELMLSYIQEENGLPPPFNLIPQWNVAMNIIKSIKNDIIQRSTPPPSYYSRQRRREFASSRTFRPVKKYQYVIKKIIKRYIYEKIFPDSENDHVEESEILTEAPKTSPLPTCTSRCTFPSVSECDEDDEMAKVNGSTDNLGNQGNLGWKTNNTHGSSLISKLTKATIEITAVTDRTQELLGERQVDGFQNGDEIAENLKRLKNQTAKLNRQLSNMSNGSIESEPTQSSGVILTPHTLISRHSTGNMLNGVGSRSNHSTYL